VTITRTAIAGLHQVAIRAVVRFTSEHSDVINRLGAVFRAVAHLRCEDASGDDLIAAIGRQDFAGPDFAAGERCFARTRLVQTTRLDPDTSDGDEIYVRCRLFLHLPGIAPALATTADVHDSHRLGSTVAAGARDSVSRSSTVP